MRRFVSAFALAVVSAVLPVASTGGPADAVLTSPDIVGQLVDATTDDPVANTTIELHQGAATGAVVDTATTDGTGHFTVTPGVTDAPYWVEVVRNARVQGGFVRDDPEPTADSWVEFDASGATPVAPGTDLGRVLDDPSFISGKVVNAANGAELRGIIVSTREVGALATVVGSDTTDTNGFFRIPIFGEDFGLRLNGHARGFETGWRGCAGGVVPTWGAACQSPIGRISKTRLDHL
jgi:hypothetical protein